jgi:hypothetical protein
MNRAVSSRLLDPAIQSGSLKQIPLNLSEVTAMRDGSKQQEYLNYNSRGRRQFRQMDWMLWNSHLARHSEGLCRP